MLPAIACGGAARPGAVDVEPPAVEDPAADAPDPSLGTELDAVPLPRPPRPWLPMGVQWSPSTPREGQAVGVWLLQPRAGRRPVEIRGDLGGRPVHFDRVGGDWFGVASAPIGASGDAELTLRIRISADSTLTQRFGFRIHEREFAATRLSVAPRFSDPEPEALIRIREERKLIRAVLAQATPRWLPHAPFVWPRETRITSPFGQRRLFNQELTSRHTGVDLAGGSGAPVRAAARGRVALIGDFYFSGNAVYVDHGLGVYTAYFHLSQTGVTEGETVEKGQVIGEVGATGRVTGPHLHWALYVNGHSLDASSLFEIRPPETPPAPRPTPTTESPVSEGPDTDAR